MTKRRDITNLPASVHDRMLKLARAQGIQHQEALQSFVMEHFLFAMATTVATRGNLK
jgi:hypothetical protein